MTCVAASTSPPPDLNSCAPTTSVSPCTPTSSAARYLSARFGSKSLESSAAAAPFKRIRKVITKLFKSRCRGGGSGAVGGGGGAGGTGGASSEESRSRYMTELSVPVGSKGV
eukprot:1072976-Prorocentrum_minimum.AAC.2